jgi:phage portal protein BeeE
VSLFHREVRSISYQDVFGRGYDWSSSSGKYTGESALALAAVQGCLRLRSQLVGQLPLKSMRMADGIDVPSAVQPQVITAPSPLVPLSVWLVQMQVSRDLFGTAFGYVTSWDGAGFPRTVEWLDPCDVTTRQDAPSGAARVFLNGGELDASRVLLVPSSFVMPGSPLGVAPLDATGLVEVATLAREFGRDWFRSGAVPATVVYLDHPLTSEQAEEASDRIAARWRKRKPAVVGSTVKSIDINEVKANEAQFLETQTAIQAEICQCFSVLPAWLGITTSGSSVTYANVAQQKQHKLDSMSLDLRIIEDILSGPAVAPRGQYVKFNTGAYLQADLIGRYESYKIAAEIQSLTGEPLLVVDEMRELENRAPLTPEQKAAARPPAAPLPA